MFSFVLITILSLTSSWSSSWSVISSESISRSNNDLYLQLQSRFLEEIQHKPRNIFFAPFSISTAMNMLYVGARGDTQREMRAALNYDETKLSDKEIEQQFETIHKQIQDLKTKSEAYDLDSANRIVSEDSIVYSDVLTRHLELSSITQIDLSDKTRDQFGWNIRFNNLLYFKASFKVNFNRDLTRNEIFHNYDGEEQTSELMTRVGKFNYTDLKEVNAKMLEIPYFGDDISLFVILPNKGRNLKDVINSIDQFGYIEDRISKMSEGLIDVRLPRFRIETEYWLKDTFEGLPKSKIVSAFNSKSDFSGFVSKNWTQLEDLKVSDISHKARIEVKEEGTQTNAKTEISSLPVSDTVPLEGTAVFRADHPFLFFIRDNKRRIVLFGGSVLKMTPKPMFNSDRLGLVQIPFNRLMLNII